MRKIVAFTLVVVLLTSCQKNWFVVSNKNAEEKHKVEGIMYSLPRTAVDVDISINVYHYTPGPFSQYAHSYMNISNVEQQAMSFWEIDAVNIRETIEADPAAKYWIVPNKIMPDIQLTAQGILAGINTTLVFDAPENVERFFPVRKKLPNDILFTDLGVKRNKYEVIDTIWRVIERDSVIKRIPVYQSVEKEKAWHHKAQDAANFIIKIRKRRFKLEAAIEEQQGDGEGVGIMIEKLEALEQTYLELFIGKTEVEKRYSHWRIVPESAKSTQHFHLAFLDIETADIVDTEAQAHNLKLVFELHNTSFTNQINPEKLSDVGLITRQSAVGTVYLDLNGDVVFKKNLNLPQMGGFFNIPSKLMSEDTKILINPKTGSLQMIE